MRAAACSLVLLAACSDYDIKSHDDPSDGGVPALSADPGAVDLGLVCGEAAQEIALSNTGDVNLTITGLEIVGEGWEIEAPTVPFVVTPGTGRPILVSGSGTAELVVSSDDPAKPEVRIPLSAEADARPTVSIYSPGAAEILGVGAATVFQAEVGDDRDLPSSLTVSWESDVDGVLSTVAPDDRGQASFVWDAAAVSSGPHTVTLTVTDACGGQAQDTRTVCQNEGYIEESIDIATWNFEGTARWDGANGWVELTQPLTNQAGTAFQTSSTVASDNVSIAFQFYVSGGTGADGMSLTALDADRMTSFVGSSGGGIGYAGLPGWSIEIDTWYNGEHPDPTTEDHLSVHIDGNQASPVVWATLPEMEDGAWHSMAVSVSGEWMTVAIDGVTYLNQPVAGLVPFPAYVGFTAATGSVTNYHLVDALQVEAFVCDE